MSDSFFLRTASYGPWLKLSDFLRYFSLCEGMWIGESAGFWYKVITDNDIRIDTQLFTDSGGGSLSMFEIWVIDPTAEVELIFNTSVEFEDTAVDSTAFAQRIRLTYNYMSEYVGDREFEEGNVPRPDTIWGYASADDFEDLDVFNPRLWNDMFCGLEDTKRIEISASGVDIPLPAFQLAEAMCYNHAETILKIAGMKELQVAKDWAAYVLLAMRRTLYTAC